jgi:hypothetical protein
MIAYFRLSLLGFATSIVWPAERERMLLLAAFSFLLWTARKAHALGGEL